MRYKEHTAVSTKVVQNKRKSVRNNAEKLRIHIVRHLKYSLHGRGIIDSELLLKFIGYFPDYLSALLRTLLRFFGQPLSKQLYTATPTKTSLENIALFHLCYFTIISTRSTAYRNSELPKNQIDRLVVQVKKENEKFTVVCSRSPQNLKFGQLMLLLCRGW